VSEGFFLNSQTSLLYIFKQTFFTDISVIIVYWTRRNF